jgi:hypothetical protein
MLAELEAQRMTLRETLLRISGAMQVLEEELSKSDPVVQNGQQSEDVALHTQS